MVVYSIQPLSVLKKIMKGEYYPDNLKIPQDFIRAYKWYMRQAGLPRYPIWIWKERPDLRKYRTIQDSNLKKGKVKFALLKLEIPDHLILLTDFGLWHMVLNNQPICYNEKEFNKLAKASQKQIEATWKRIIYKNENSYQKFDSKWIGKVELQGIVAKITPSMILEIKYFSQINK